MLNFFAILLTCIFISTASFASDNLAFLEPYKTLLGKYVKEGTKSGIRANLVNYKDWGQDPLHKETLMLLQESKPSTLDENEFLSFWINAYNFLTIDLIIKNNETKSIKNLGSIIASPWKIYSWELEGRKYNLDLIEHKILRQAGEPRIHMAIVCASLSCPDLLAEPYYPSRIEFQLSEATENFLKNDTKGLKITGNDFTMSKIFSWFEEDFGSIHDLYIFLQTYNGGINQSYRIKGYFDYNWKLNSQ